jgi:hypothetical protein
MPCGNIFAVFLFCFIIYSYPSRLCWRHCPGVVRRGGDQAGPIYDMVTPRLAL